MPETTLTLPVEAMSVVAASVDAAGDPAALDGEPKLAAADFAQLLANEMSPEEAQVQQTEQLPEPELPGLEPLPSTPLELNAALPNGKPLPPESGTPVPPTASQAAPMPEPALPTPLTMTVEAPPASMGTAPDVVTAPSAESSPVTLHSVAQAPIQSRRQTANPATTNAVQSSAPVPASAAPAVQEPVAIADPGFDVRDEALLVKLAEREPRQALAYKAPAESTPAVGAPGTTLAAPDLPGKEVAPAPRLELPEPMRTPQWNDGLASRITWMTNNQVQKAELRLNPPELGPLEVRVAVQQDETRIVFTANNAAVREAVEAALPRLRELMGASGLNLVQVDVSAQGQDNRGQLRDWAEAAGDHDAAAASRPDETEATTHWRPAAAHDGLFDDFA